MAQWAWQFTGQSHTTKVNDFEVMLTHAIEVYKASGDVEKAGKAKSAKKLAAKVLNARLKLIKAKLNETEPVKSEDWANARNQVMKLRELEVTLGSDGVAGILLEFGAPELAEI